MSTYALVAVYKARGAEDVVVPAELVASAASTRPYRTVYVAHAERELNSMRLVVLG